MIADPYIKEQQRVYELILAKSGPVSTRILELGCSMGRFMEYLIKKGNKHVEGVDGDARDVRRAREKGLKVHRGELTELEQLLGGRQFDLVIARGVFCDSAQRS